MDAENDTRRTEAIEGLREFADFLEANPEAGAPFSTILAMSFCDSGPEMAERAKRFGGRWQKHDGVEGYFQLMREFGPCACYRISTARANVCERIVTGTREVVVSEPDPDAVAALPKVTRTETVEDVEWVCPDSLLAVA